MRRRRQPTPPATPALGLGELIAAPELAALDLLDHALRVATLAVLAQHPHLLGDEYGRVAHDGDPVAATAERWVLAMAKLRPILEHYRRAVVDACHDRGNDDLPF